MSDKGELLIRMGDEQKEEFDEEAAALGISSPELGRRYLFSPPPVETAYVNDVRMAMIRVKHRLEEAAGKVGDSDNSEIMDILNKVEETCVELLKELRKISRTDSQKMNGEKEQTLENSYENDQKEEKKSRSIYDDFTIC